MKKMKILGTVNINGEDKVIRVEKNGDIYKYYLEEQVIGAFDPDVMGDTLIAFRENSLENELSGEIRDEIIQLIETAGKDEILEVKEEREQDENIYTQERGYQREIGQNKEDSRTEKKQDKVEDKLKANKNEKSINSDKKIENTTGDINIKQTVDMDTMVTDMDSMGEKLEKAGKIKGSKEKNGKLGIVESDELKNLRDENGNELQGHSSRYEAVVITNERGKDGKPIVRALDLENDTQEGTNPTERNYQIKQNDESQKGDVLTRLKIQGQETIGIEKGDYGEVEVYHSHNKTLGGEGVEGNQSLDRQVETSNSKNPIEGTDQATQKLAQEYQDGYRSVEETYQEAKQHENDKREPCEEIEVEDLDGDPNTSSHSHIDDTVSKLMENGEIAEKFTEREVREMVTKAWENRSDEQTLEEFQKKVEDDIEYDAQYMRGGRER